MKATVTIIENATGEKVEHVDEWSVPQTPNDLCTPADYLVHSWQDGNNSCDCNREIFFRRAKGWTEDEIWADDTGFCIGTGRYRVPHMELETGDRVTVDGAQ